MLGLLTAAVVKVSLGLLQLRDLQKWLIITRRDEHKTISKFSLTSQQEAETLARCCYKAILTKMNLLGIGSPADKKKITKDTFPTD
ncbi:uncharacterized [Tachysurus ichikawai]